MDAGLTVFAAFAAHSLRFDSLDMSVRYELAVLVWSSVVVISLFVVGVYGSWRGQSFAHQAGRVLLGWLFAAVLLATFAFLLKISADYSRQWFAYTMLIGATASVLLRGLVFLTLRHLRRAGRNLKQVLVLAPSSETRSRLPAESLLREQGFHVASVLSLEDIFEDWENRLVSKVDEARINEVWMMLPLDRSTLLKSAAYALRHHVVTMRFLPQLDDLPLLNHQVSHIAGLHSIDLSVTPMDGAARVLKRAEDLLVGGLLFLLILPVCVFIALAIKLTSPGPVLFKQYRTGINGKPFKVYKFRSMVIHSETDGQVTQAKKGDSRVTPIGAFLRRTSLDELPQFFNVLQGRMSIVGPRPHALAHNEYYKDLVESYMQRHKVKPGITGWAQVNGLRGETDTLEKMQARVEHDLWYIDNWSLWLDLKIILLTVFKGFVNPHAY